MSGDVTFTMKNHSWAFDIAETIKRKKDYWCIRVIAEVLGDVDHKEVVGLSLVTFDPSKHPWRYKVIIDSLMCDLPIQYDRGEILPTPEIIAD